MCCNPLQHTATHLNTTINIVKSNKKHRLQHTATHCNTLQRTAQYYNALQQKDLPDEKEQEIWQSKDVEITARELPRRPGGGGEGSHPKKSSLESTRIESHENCDHDIELNWDTWRPWHTNGVIHSEVYTYIYTSEAAQRCEKTQKKEKRKKERMRKTQTLSHLRVLTWPWNSPLRRQGVASQREAVYAVLRAFDAAIGTNRLCIQLQLFFLSFFLVWLIPNILFQDLLGRGYNGCHVCCKIARIWVRVGLGPASRHV